jgi:dTDP-4-dehydrorhamnose 3,5-epimerase-like enzyme
MATATVEEIKFPTDPRGFVFEPLDAQRLPVQRNVHVAVSEPNAIRGNHFHQHSIEVAVVIGPALVRLREDGEIRDVPVPEGRAYQFTFPPGVSHAFQGRGTKPMLLVAFSSTVFDPAAPDVVRDILISQ